MSVPLSTVVYRSAFALYSDVVLVGRSSIHSLSPGRRRRPREGLFSDCFKFLFPFSEMSAINFVLFKRFYFDLDAVCGRWGKEICSAITRNKKRPPEEMLLVA